MNYVFPDWPAPQSIHAYTTTRHINVSHENKQEKLATLLDLPEEPVRFSQKHTAIALPATEQNRMAIADAAFTNEKKRVCLVSTADCLPLLVCNKQGTYVAAIHAGWRGMAAGVIEATLTALNQPAADLLVWLGPAIGPEKFEVGRDVYEAFTHPHPEAIAAFKPHSEEKWLANLYQLATMRLQKQGVTQIYGGNFCTYTQNDLFFSYRRNKGHIGRMASLIWID